MLANPAGGGAAAVKARMTSQFGKHARGVGRWQERERRALGPGAELLDRKLRGLGFDPEGERSERREGTPEGDEPCELHALPD